MAPGDPLGSFQSFGKNLAPQGETSPSRRRAAKKLSVKFQFVEQIQGRTSIRVIPVCTLCETEHPGHLNVRGVLRHCVPNKGLHPLRRESGYPLKAKDVTTFVTPFAYFTVLRTTPETGGVKTAAM